MLDFPKNHPTRGRRRLGFAAKAVLALAALALAALAGLAWLEALLVHETPMQPVDAALVGDFGGEMRAAADLYGRGMVQSVLIAVPPPEDIPDDPFFVSVNRIIRERLIAAGVSEEDIHSVPRTPLDAMDRQRMLREWVYAHGVRSYLKFALRLHSGLEHMVHRDTFPRGDVTLVLKCTDGPVIWRKHMLGAQNTLIRMAYWTRAYRPRIRRDPLPPPLDAPA